MSAEILQHEQPRPLLLRPIADLQEILAANEQLTKIVVDYLQDGTDYGQVPGTKGKKSLYKAGAERINVVFGTYVEYEIVEKEVDHNLPIIVTTRTKQWKNRFQGDREFDWIYEEQTVRGIYRFIVKATMRARGSSELLGSAIASCSTLESKYHERPRELENTVLKMAEKRALVAVTLNVFGLSDRFTQDVEDLDLGNGVPAEEKDKPAGPPPATPPAGPGAESARKASAYLRSCGASPEWCNDFAGLCKSRKVSWTKLTFAAEEAGVTDLEKILATVPPAKEEIIEAEFTVETPPTGAPGFKDLGGAQDAPAGEGETIPQLRGRFLDIAGGQGWVTEPDLRLAALVGEFVDGQRPSSTAAFTHAHWRKAIEEAEAVVDGKREAPASANGDYDPFLDE